MSPLIDNEKMTGRLSVRLQGPGCVLRKGGTAILQELVPTLGEGAGVSHHGAPALVRQKGEPTAEAPQLNTPKGPRLDAGKAGPYEANSDWGVSAVNHFRPLNGYGQRLGGSGFPVPRSGFPIGSAPRDGSELQVSS